jgi:tetratricopeptide (TPR) repeat protein
VLVAQDGDEVIPRVIDFGVAKAIDEDLATATRFTRQGQVLGTPQYMSPEQADRNGLDVDTRSDVYSLGILLYELLTGDTPLEKERLKSISHDELSRLVREQETAAPSSRISTVGVAAETISQNRSTDPDRLRQLLRRELDWISLKALHKQCEHRYSSPSALGEDIERFLNGMPVLAGPPGGMYRARKFVRRNRVLVVAATAVAASLLIGLATTLMTLGELHSTVAALEASRDDVLEQAEIAKSNLDLTAGMLMSVERNPNVTVLEMLDEFVRSDLPARLEGEHPEVRATHRLLIGKIYARLGEQNSAQRFFADAVNDRREQGDQLRLADALTDSAENSLYCCHYSDSHEAASEAVAIFEDSDSENAQHARRLAESAKIFLKLFSDVCQVMTACDRNHRTEAERIKQQLESSPSLKPSGVLNTLLAMLFADVEDFAFAAKVVQMPPLSYGLASPTSATEELPALFANVVTYREFGLGFLATRQGIQTEAQKHYKTVLQQMRKFPVRNSDNDWVEAAYSWALLYQKDPSEEDILEAERRAQIALGYEDYVAKAIAHHSLALAKSKRGDLKSAIESQQRALKILTQPDQPRLLLLQLVVEEQLAEYHLEDDDPQSAAAVAYKAIKWRRDNLEPDHPNSKRAEEKLTTKYRLK